VSALNNNTSGYRNTASGYLALASNTTGNGNTGIGNSALFNNAVGAGNIAVGENAGLNSTGNYNIDIGNAGVAAEATTIRIGTEGVQTRAFMAGIRGVAPAVNDAVGVVIDSNGQLGAPLLVSSRRYKFDIDSMAGATDGLMRLRPVTFRYLAQGENGPLQYGLIAEEVAEVYPEMVVRNKDGEVETVKYQFLAPMLLNEVQKQRKTIDTLQEEHQRIDEQQKTIDRLERRLRALEAELAQSRQ
jgi:hypothetical protein